MTESENDAILLAKSKPNQIVNVKILPSFQNPPPPHTFNKSISMLGAINRDAHTLQDYTRAHAVAPITIRKQIDTITTLTSTYKTLKEKPDSQGAYGQIIKVKNRGTNRYHALKQTAMDEGGGVCPPTLREIVIMQELTHVNVMRYINIM
jgi:hypothetical protein